MKTILILTLFALQAAQAESVTHEKTRDKCVKYLFDAIKDGNPNPDTSHIENCSWAPLHFAYTLEHVQTLLDAGADANARGEHGITPLTIHLQQMMVDPEETKYRIIQALLDAGADPWITDNRGQLPIDLAKRMREKRLAEPLLIKRSEIILQEMKEKGVFDEEEFFTQFPAIGKRMKAWRQGPQFVEKTLATVSEAMRRTNPGEE